MFVRMRMRVRVRVPVNSRRRTGEMHARLSHAAGDAHIAAFADVRVTCCVRRSFATHTHIVRLPEDIAHSLVCQMCA